MLYGLNSPHLNLKSCLWVCLELALIATETSWNLWKFDLEMLAIITSWTEQESCWSDWAGVEAYFHLTKLTQCMLGNFSQLFCRLLTFFKLNFFKKFFQEHYQSVKQFGSRSGPTLCWAWSGSKLFAKIISRRQKSPLPGKELISHYPLFTLVT